VGVDVRELVVEPEPERTVRELQSRLLGDLAAGNGLEVLTLLDVSSGRSPLVGATRGVLVLLLHEQMASLVDEEEADDPGHAGQR